MKAPIAAWVDGRCRGEGTQTKFAKALKLQVTGVSKMRRRGVACKERSCHQRLKL